MSGNPYATLAAGQYTSEQVTNELVRQDWRQGKPVNLSDVGFDQLDKNGDGVITRDEFMQSMAAQSMGSGANLKAALGTRSLNVAPGGGTPVPLSAAVAPGASVAYGAPGASYSYVAPAQALQYVSPEALQYAVPAASLRTYPVPLGGNVNYMAVGGVGGGGACGPGGFGPGGGGACGPGGFGPGGPGAAGPYGPGGPGAGPGAGPCGPGGCGPGGAYGPGAGPGGAFGPGGGPVGAFGPGAGPYGPGGLGGPGVAGYGPYGPGYNQAYGPGYDAEGKIVGQYDGAPYLVGESMSHESQYVQGVQNKYTVNKVVEKPTTVIKEREKHVKKPTIIERVIEVPKEEIREVTRVGPPKVVHKEQIEEVPQVVTEQRVIRRAKKVVQERLIEVPKIEYVERIEYDDVIEYREVPVDKIVEVPEIEYRVREVEQLVPQSYVQEYFVDNYQEVPITQVQETAQWQSVPVYAPGAGGAAGAAAQAQPFSYNLTQAGGAGAAQAGAVGAVLPGTTADAAAMKKSGRWVWMDDEPQQTVNAPTPPVPYMTTSAPAYAAATPMLPAGSQALPPPSTLYSSTAPAAYTSAVTTPQPYTYAAPPVTSPPVSVAYAAPPVSSSLTSYAAPPVTSPMMARPAGTVDLFDQIDRNHDGKITREEFINSFVGSQAPVSQLPGPIAAN